jgi:acetyltransferase-like isoleucine patch superfamily enzyme
VAASAGVARTASIRALGGYDPAFEHSCDAYLWRQLAIEGPVGYVHERLYERRFHPQSMSRGARRSEVLESEHTEQLARVFGRDDLPGRVGAMRRRAFAELHWKIAHAYFGERQLGRSVANASLALRSSGAAVARHLAARPLRRIKRAWNRFRHSSSDRYIRGESSDRSVFVHETALCESEDVGQGTTIWAFAHVMEGARLGTACKIGDHVFVETGAVIGDRVTIKNGTLVWDRILIDDDVFVGPGVVFTNDLVPRAHITRRGADLVSTHVHRGASIGANATIVCGTMIGAHAMIGAAAVVTQDVAAHALVVGNPASQIAWVCRCGLRLGPELGCDCGMRYRLTEGAGGIELESA